MKLDVEMDMDVNVNIGNNLNGRGQERRGGEERYEKNFYLRLYEYLCFYLQYFSFQNKWRLLKSKVRSIRGCVCAIRDIDWLWFYFTYLFLYYNIMCT